MQNFNVKTRNELQDDYRVFYVTAWGYAADHLIGWFPKALNCHHDMFALLAHEGSRPKYLAERTRGERPPLVTFTEFLNDMSMTYSVIGDCYSYRAGQMPELLKIERYENIPVLNVVRHPVVWLEYHVLWRSSNMRMREGATDPLAWEWKTTCHGYFEYLGLPEYGRDDINIWSAYQGMFLLNNILGDISAVDRHMPIERIAADTEVFKDTVKYLSRGKVVYEESTIDVAYSMRDAFFRGESPIDTNPDALLGNWPGWKIDAFRKLVKRETLDAYKSLGYDLGEIIQKPMVVKPAQDKVQRSIFVSSVPKSGTWLIREILEMITGLKYYEPEVGEGFPAYDDEMLVDFPPGRFFSWHSILTSRTAALLKGCQSKNIFLIRNIYDLLLSMYNHLLMDVDAGINRSVIGSDYFNGKTTEQCLTLMICGFTSTQMTWLGAGPLVRQIDSMLAFLESGHGLLIDYRDLTQNKRKTIKSILQFLELRLPDKHIEEILQHTEKDRMRDRLQEIGRAEHVTANEHAISRDAFLPYHKDMLDCLVMTEAPGLPERLESRGLNSILYLQEPEIESGWSVFKRNVRKKFHLHD